MQEKKGNCALRYIIGKHPLQELVIVDASILGDNVLKNTGTLLKLLLLNIYPIQTLAELMIGSYYLKGCLEEAFPKRLQVSVKNFKEGIDYRKIIDEINDCNPDLIGYSCYNWSIDAFSAVVKNIGKGRFINILGGPEIGNTESVRSMLKNEIGDYFIEGEGEDKMVSLVRFLLEGEGQVPNGVVYFDGGEIKYSPSTSRVDLSKQPCIYSSGVVEKKLYYRKNAFVETQRGCTLKCKYCLYHKNMNKVSFYGLDNVKKELAHLIVKEPVTSIRFVDSMFTSDLKRAKEILSFIYSLKEDHKVDLPFMHLEYLYPSVDEEWFQIISKLNNHRNVLNTDSLEAIDRPQYYFEMLNGYSIISGIGIQSMEADVLKLVKRPAHSMERLNAFFDRVKKYNIVLKIDFILGLPLETEKTFLKGLNHIVLKVRKTDHVINIHRLQMLPGSALRDSDLCEKYGVSYDPEAPYFIKSHSKMSEKGQIHCSQIAALVFRVVNTPLRETFFCYADKHGLEPVDALQKILERAQKDFPGIKLFSNVVLSDEYYNNNVFQDIPTEWLKSALD